MGVVLGSSSSEEGAAAAGLDILEIMTIRSWS